MGMSQQTAVVNYENRKGCVELREIPTPEIGPDDLEKRGEYELVTVTYKLDRWLPSDAETEINKRESFARQILRYQVEIHKKYSIPFACIIFVVVGAPLAIRMGRSGMNMAIGLSILFFLIYYVCLIGGEKLADRGFASPFVAMWAPNILFGVIAVLLLRKAAREQAVSDWTVVSVLRSIFRRHAAAHS